MSKIYSDPRRESDPHALPDVEVFPHTAYGMEDAGWYYWFCLPGCLPDSDPFGPFETEAATIADAQREGE